MKYVKWLIIFVMLFSLASIPVLALDTEMETEPMSEEDASRIVDNIMNNCDFEKITSFTPMAVGHFAVREDNTFVVCVEQSMFRTYDVIAVYDGDGNFQYGFKEKDSGETKVMWIGDEVAVYSLRSHLLYTISEDGTITDITRIKNSRENSEYRLEVLSATTQKAGDTTFEMTNGSSFSDFFSLSYKKIIRTDADGTTAVVYDATANSKARLVKSIFIVLLLLPFFACSAYISIKKTVIAIKKKSGDATFVK